MTLRTPIEELLDPPQIDERSVNRARSRLFGSLDRPASPRARRWLIAAIALGAIAAMLAFWPTESPSARRARTSAPLRLADGAMPASLRASTERRVVRFDDGSSAVLAPGATLHVRRNEPTRVDLTLVSGDVLFEIRPHGPRRWRIAMGRWDVEVVGTRFSLSRSAERLRVEVVRGLVRVTSDDGERLLGASASLELSLVAPAVETRPEGEAIAPPPSPPAAPSRPSRPRWRERAAAGDAHGAYAMLGARFTAEVRATRDVDDLFALADVARVSGHPQEAIAPLRRIVDELPRSPRTSVAAFTLGLLYGDSLARPADAARAFEQARALGLPSDLRESAASRRLEMWTRAERSVEARAAGCDYLAAHPDGPARARALEACPGD